MGSLQRDSLLVTPGFGREFGIMPTHTGKDSKGKFAQWGHQKKYYYQTSTGKKRAVSKADKQGRAAYAKGYK